MNNVTLIPTYIPLPCTLKPQGSQVLILSVGRTTPKKFVEREITALAMQSLQQKASEWSGVSTDDAFAIDDGDLFHSLGLQTFVTLSTNFYNRVYDDDEEWFRSIFGNSDKETAIQNQYEFLVQRMGGPPLYSQRRGHPALIARHRPFPVTHEAAERWLHHMGQALDSTSAIDDDKIKLMNFFRHTAYFLVAGVERKDQHHHTPCKDAALKQHPCKNF